MIEFKGDYSLEANWIFRFVAKDGREVVLRPPNRKDVDDLLELFNSIVEEGADVQQSRTMTREEASFLLERHLVNLEEEKELGMVAEVAGKVVANSRVTRRQGSPHVGELGIAIREGYRDIGIGTQMLKTMIQLSREMELKVLTLTLFSTNKRAWHVFEKVGFRVVGRVPKIYLKGGRYINEIIMALEI